MYVRTCIYVHVLYIHVHAGLEDALDKAAVYEHHCDDFDQWLAKAEVRFKSWEPLSIASQPLKRQEAEIKVKNIYKFTVYRVHCMYLYSCHFTSLLGQSLEITNFTTCNISFH